MTESVEDILNRLCVKPAVPPRAVGYDKPVIAGPQGAAIVSEIPNVVDNSDKNVISLSTDQITSPVFIISPTQISYIAENFASLVASTLNMRAMTPKIREIAEKSLRDALTSARKQGKK